MNISMKFIAATLLCVALPLQAGEPGRKKADLDTDNDGVVSADELSQHHTARFMKMDIDGDGAVSREDIAEFKARLREARTGSRADRFERADTNGDGLVSEAEAAAVARQKAAKLDADGNGVISRREMHKAFRHGERGRHGGMAMAD